MNNELVEKIKLAFADVKLEDGIGLWEAQGIDNYADEKQILDLRNKDERENLHQIPYQDIALASTSLSFVDAKGMRFLLAQFLIFDVLEKDICKEELFDAPDVVFILTNDLQSEYKEIQFRLLNSLQMKAIIDFLNYKLEQNLNDYEVSEIKKAIQHWQQKV